jgi:hypothetical protein
MGASTDLDPLDNEEDVQLRTAFKSWRISLSFNPLKNEEDVQALSASPCAPKTYGPKSMHLRSRRPKNLL